MYRKVRISYSGSFFVTDTKWLGLSSHRMRHCFLKTQLERFHIPLPSIEKRAEAIIPGKASLAADTVRPDDSHSKRIALLLLPSMMLPCREHPSIPGTYLTYALLYNATPQYLQVYYLAACLGDSRLRSSRLLFPRAAQSVSNITLLCFD